MRGLSTARAGARTGAAEPPLNRPPGRSRSVGAMGFPARSLFTRCRRVNSSGNSRLRLGSGLPNWGDAEKARQILALLPSLPEEAFESATEALLLNPKTEVPGCLLALFKIFVVPKKRATATGSGPQAAEPSSLFTARNSKHKDSGGSRDGAWGGARRAY